MSDSAPGPIAGYLFQFEKALMLLATLENVHDIVSLELVDDVAVQDENNIVLMAVQAKHSISPNGTTFEDTSSSLWRTLQIWIQKLENGTFNTQTQFICSTNKEIHAQSLVKRIETETLEDVVTDITKLLASQKAKLQNLQVDKPEAGPSIKKTIKLIEFVLSKPNQFEIIKNNITVRDKEDLIEKFFIAIHMTSDEYTDARKTSTFEAMYGWITNRCKAKWLNDNAATFTKKDFDTKLALVTTNPAIINAVFRKKSALGTVDHKKVADTKKELFVTQIEDIKRKQTAKERNIENAVLDFIYHDIEMAHIIAKGNFTEPDFEEFKGNCRDRWQTCYDSHVLKELDEYDDDMKNDLAIAIFDNIMNSIEVSFQEGIRFTSANRYIHNGTFLKLSNVPEIGWHPEWETKYKK